MSKGQVLRRCPKCKLCFMEERWITLYCLELRCPCCGYTEEYCMWSTDG